jgi:UDP-glucose 4-epimerase
MPKKILVTGGSGFIGTHLSRALKNAGHSVRVLDLVIPARPLEGVEYLQGDVRDAETVAKAVRGMDAVYHFAAIVSVPVCQNNPFDSYRTNHLATALILDSIKKEGEKTGSFARLIFSSTAASYGMQGREGVPLSETDIAPEPPSFYAAQKLGSEHAIRLFHEVYGLPAVVFRFFNVFGPGQDPSSPYSGVISVFLDAIQKGKSLRLNGGGIQTRDFISVHDIVSACVRALELPDQLCDGSAMNLGTRRAITIKHLADVMINASGKPIPTEIAPPRAGDVLHSLADNGRASKVLGWAPQVSLEVGLQELLGSQSLN